MRKHMLSALASSALLFCSGTVLFSAEIPSVTLIKKELPKTLLLEANASVQRGVDFLMSRQMENGSWLNDPAITGLIAVSLHQSKLSSAVKAAEKAREFILKSAQKDGSFMGAKPQYVNYTTAVCLSTLAIMGKKEDIEVMRAARKYLIGSQLTEDNPTVPTQKDNPFYGGIGYGSGGPDRPDLSNTQWALEALYLTESLDREQNGGKPEDAKKSDLAWANALRFLQKVQKVPESADSSWGVNSSDTKNDGGFIYMPGNSKASDKAKDADTLRSYGSMTYAGLKSMVYAKLSKDDYRVKAAVDWAGKNYTLDENPGIGAEGHYYYIQTFAKALAAFGQDTLKTADGKEREWRVDLIRKALQLQRGDGSWYNDNGRWMESIPELSTAYVLISVEIALSGSAN